MTQGQLQNIFFSTCYIYYLSNITFGNFSYNWESKGKYNFFKILTSKMVLANLYLTLVKFIFILSTWKSCLYSRIQVLLLSTWWDWFCFCCLWSSGFAFIFLPLHFVYKTQSNDYFKLLYRRQLNRMEISII